MKILKDTFQQSLKLHIYWWEFKKSAQTHVHINTHTNKHIRLGKHTRMHVPMDYRPNYMIIYIQTYPYRHRLTKIYFN